MPRSSARWECWGGGSDVLDGQIAYSEGRYAEALKLLDKAYVAFGLRLEPVTALLLMRLYQRIGMPGKAEAILNRFLRDPQQRANAALWVEKARIVAGYGRWHQAERYVSEAIRIDAGNEDARQLLAVIALNTGRLDRLPTGMKPTGQVVPGVLIRAQSLWADGQRQQAVALVEDLFSRIPDNMQVAQHLVNMYQLSPAEAKLKALLKKLKSTQPSLARQIQHHQALLAEKDPTKRLAMQVEYAGRIEDELRRELTLADLYGSAGQTDKFVEHLDRAGRLKPDSPGVILRRLRYAVATKNWELAEQAVAAGTKANIDGANGQLLAARLATDRGNDDLAVRLYTGILTANANNMQARLSRGQLLMRGGRLAEAADDFRAVAAGNPGNATAAISMMLVAERLGKQDEYDEWLDRAHRLAPRHQEVASRYTNRQEQLSTDPAEIIAQREKQLAQNPRDLDNRLRLGLLYERTGKITQAEKMLVSVRQLAADKLLATRHLAGFYARTNRLGQADTIIQDLVRGARTTDGKVDAYVLYGQFLAPYKPDQAERAFGNAIQADPKNPAGHHALARFHAAKGTWDQAIRAMTQCVELRKDVPGFERELIGFQISAGKFPDAQSRLGQILKASPTEPSALRLQAQLHLARDNDVISAERVLTEAVNANAADVISRATRARLYLSAGLLRKARDDLEKISRITADVQAAVDLGAVYTRLKQYAQAEVTLKSVLRRRPKLQSGISRLAGAYLAQKKWADLERLLTGAIRGDPKNPAYAVIESQMWSRRGQQDKALASLLTAVSIAPDNSALVGTYLGSLLRAEQYAKVLEVTGFYVGKKGFASTVPALRARALAKSGKVDQAEAIFRPLVKNSSVQSLGFLAGHMVESFGRDKAIARLPEWRGRPKEWQLHHVLAGLHRGAENLPKAAKALVKARGLTEDKSVDRARMETELGMTYYRMGRHAEAEKAYLAALPIMPNDASLLNNIAYLYAVDLKCPADALPYAEKAYARAPGSVNVLDTYGWVLALLKRYGEAEEYLTQAAELPNTVPVARYHLGVVHQRQGKPAEALKQYKLALEMVAEKPGEKDLREKLSAAIKQIEGKSRQ